MIIEKKLVKRIRKGDQKAFRTLYEMYFPKVINYAFKILHSWEDSREIAQDVFLKIWDKRHDLDSERSLSGLIFKVTKFSSIDRIRRDGNRIKTLTISSDMELNGVFQENEYLNNELQTIYLQILNGLPEKRRYIFQLSRDKNLSYKEIADELNLSIKTVETQIGLALQQFRKELARYSDVMVLIVGCLFFYQISF